MIIATTDRAWRTLRAALQLYSKVDEPSRLAAWLQAGGDEASVPDRTSVFRMANDVRTTLGPDTYERLRPQLRPDELEPGRQPWKTRRQLHDAGLISPRDERDDDHGPRDE